MRSPTVLRQALLLQNAVHLRLQSTQLFLSHRVNLFRVICVVVPARNVHRVVLIATRQLPDAGIAGRALAMHFELGDLPIERRCNLVRRDLRGLRCIVALHALRASGDCTLYQSAILPPRAS